jgi:hypothetical protein
VHDLHTPFFNYELVKRALTFGIEGSDAQRELISRLLSLLYGEQNTPAVEQSVGCGMRLPCTYRGCRRAVSAGLTHPTHSPPAPPFPFPQAWI